MSELIIEWGKILFPYVVGLIISIYAGILCSRLAAFHKARHDALHHLTLLSDLLARASRSAVSSRKIYNDTKEYALALYACDCEKRRKAVDKVETKTRIQRSAKVEKIRNEMNTLRFRGLEISSSLEQQWEFAAGKFVNEMFLEWCIRISTVTLMIAENNHETPLDNFEQDIRNELCRDRVKILALMPNIYRLFRVRLDIDLNVPPREII